MADVEEASADQLNITVDSQLNIEAQAPSQPSGLAEDQNRKAVFKAGLSLTLISTGGILNPPISATANKTHSFLSQTLHVMVCVSLAIGVVLMLLSTALRLNPRLIIKAKLLTQLGWGLLSMALGSGSALVLMVSSPPWFVLFLIFLSVSLK